MSSLQPKKLNKIKLKAQLSNTKIICGLGNTGAEYNNTWHNLGKSFVSYLKESLLKTGTIFNESSFAKSQIYSSPEFPSKIIELSSFMNLSGENLAAYMRYYKINPESLLLCYDDLDLEFGDYKISFANSPKVHNGVNSVISNLGSDQFWQVRIGANTSLKSNYSVRADYILSVIATEYQNQLDPLFKAITASLLLE